MSSPRPGRRGLPAALGLVPVSRGAPFAAGRTAVVDGNGGAEDEGVDEEEGVEATEAGGDSVATRVDDATLDASCAAPVMGSMECDGAAALDAKMRPAPERPSTLRSRPRRMAMTAASADPEEMPRVYGSASGLRSTA